MLRCPVCRSPLARLAWSGLPYDYAQVTATGGVLQVVAGNSYHTARYWYSHDGTTFTGAPVPCPVDTTTPTLAGIQSGHVLVVCSGDPADPQPGEQQKELVIAPAPGQITSFRAPLGPGIRLDTFVETGSTVPPFYDSLLGKLAIWDEDRPAAISPRPRST